MHQKHLKILFAIFGLTALVLAVILIIQARSLRVTVSNPQIKAVDTGQLKSNYQQSIRQISAELDKMLNGATSVTGGTARLKQQALDLKVPKEYQNLHLSLVLLIDKIESLSKDGKNNAEARVMLDKIKSENKWVN
jgi:hypothetical protein